MTDPLRVIHFHFGKEGGAERFFVNLAQALGRRGGEQRFIIRPKRSWEAQIADLGPVICNNFPVLSPMTPLLHWRANRWVQDWHPHAVMSWMPRAARLMHRWPNVVKLNRMGDFPQNLKHFKNCDILIGNMPGISQTCRNLGWTRPVHTITNFTPLIAPIPVPRAAHGTPEDAFLIAAGGRFQPVKAMDMAVRALARIPGAWLWLIGEGGLRPKIENLAAELGVTDRLRFVGWVENPIHYIAAADAFLLPSRHEPLGNILLEAWAAGVPAVATRSEGPSWFMRDGVEGLMADIDDDAGIAAALIRIRDDPDSARTYAANARARLEEMFSEEVVCRQYLQLFRGDFSRETL